MPPERFLYPTKDLRYKICEFLIDKRIKTPGLGNILKIKGEEIRDLLEFAITSNGNTREDVFIEELIHIEDEVFNDTKLLIIENKEVLNNFDQWIRGGSVLKVRCDSKMLENYISELKNRTRVALRNLGLAEIKPLPSGGIEVILGDKEMKVHMTKKHDFNLYITIIQLTSGAVITMNGNERILEKNYKKGDHISYNQLLEILRSIEGNENTDESKINDKSIKDAIRYINSRAETELGISLLEKDKTGLKWVR
jgi:hypothetical protein